MADPLTIVGLAINVPSLIQACFQSYEYLSAKLKDFRTADQQINQFCLALELNWFNLEHSLSLLMRITDTMEPSVYLLMQKVLMQLQDLLLQFSSKLQNCYERHGTGIRRIAFSFGLKNDLKQFLDEFDSWHDRFTRRMYLVSVSLIADLRGKRTADEAPVDHTQGSRLGVRPFAHNPKAPAPLLQDSQKPNLETLRPVPFSNVMVGELPGGCSVLVEYRSFAQDSRFGERMWCLRSVRAIADMMYTDDRLLEAPQARNSALDETLKDREDSRSTALKSRDPVAKGILDCIGYFGDEANFRYAFVSKLPIGLSKNAKSLQHLLCGKENKNGFRHDLNDRVDMARSLAPALLAIHAADFVHKSIRPSNILVFDPESDNLSLKFPYTLGQPVLVGFEQARPDSDDSERCGSDVWEENIYRHPSRQGLYPGVKYSMLHDVYSLGSRWAHNAEFWGSLYGTRRKERDPEKIKDLYLKLVRGAVPRHIGGRFAEVIETCLTCLEGSFGAKSEDDDTTLGLAYIEKVVEKLETILL